MALPLIAKGVIAFDIGNRLPCQPKGLRRIDWRCRRGFAVRQPVQNVDDMGFGGNARFKRQFYGTQYRLLVMLKNESQDLDHLPITARALEKLSLQLPEGVRQLDKGCAIAQSPRFALDDGEIVPPIIDRPPW
jgi:hypothetical protein